MNDELLDFQDNDDDMLELDYELSVTEIEEAERVLAALAIVIENSTSEAIRDIVEEACCAIADLIPLREDDLDLDAHAA